ncbi:unnamed protein product, partial [Polarella glacialis]
WVSLLLHGSWTEQTCGGTPIPVRQPVLATAESWARNPQCRLVLGEGEESDVELCVTLQQPDARMRPGSPFPFEDRLRELFVCVLRLDDPSERLVVFDKRRIHRSGTQSAASLLSRRREVLLRTRLPCPGSYAIVPSTREPELGGATQAPFLLSLHLRCKPDLIKVDAPPTEGWAPVQEKQ